MAAELVAGALLSASLQVLFERLTSVEIPQLFQGKKPILKLLDRLNTRLLSAKELLNDAEEKQLGNESVKKWLFKLQDVIYEAGDLVDRIDCEALLSKLGDDQSCSSASKVFHQLKSMSPFLSTFDKTVQCDATEILLKLDDLLDQKDALGLREGPQNKPLQRPPAPLVEQSDVYGRDGEKKVIVEQLLKDDVEGGHRISVIPIFGMGGVGKTTLAQLVYDDDRVQKHFELKVWVTVSDEFDISKITKEIFEGVTSNKCDIENSDELRRKLKEALHGKKFLFVHDDVWNESYSLWDTLKSCFNSGAQGSKIIVTTRSTTVASTMATGQIHHLQTLLDEDCWQLFVKHAFGNSFDLNDYQNLQVIGRKIVAKCKGLPLAIKSLGGLLRSERNSEKWEDVLNSHTWEELYKKEGSILPALWLSYRHLPAHLKQCFAYCSIFPKDYHFEREKLILLWMAEGFLQFEKRHKKMEHLGEEYLCDLLSRSFFQQSSKNKSFLQMHDLVHDLAMLVSDDFCFRLDLSNDVHGLSTKIRHLSYRTGTYDLNTLECLSKANCLRTFLAVPFEWHHTTFISYDMLFTTGSCLRVLSLNQSSIKVIPDSIGNLKHLRDLCQLPKDMGSLINLRYLEIDGTPLKELPQEISNMKHLYFLSNMVLSDRNSAGCKMKKVGKLDNLRCISGLENVVNAREASQANLKEKKGLSKLSLSWNDNAGVADSSQKEKNILDVLRPHTNLEHLEIERYRGTTFSDWVGDSAFSNLVSVSLVDCKNCCVLPPLGQLVFLKNLLICRCDSVISIGDEIPHHKGPLFCCLEELRIYNMLEWKDWSFSSEVVMQEGQLFPLLKKLSLSCCPKLSVGLPACLPSLELVNINSCEKMVTLLPRTQHIFEAPPSLVSLSITNCPVLESLLDWGPNSKVKRLVLGQTKTLFENRKQWDLHRLSCLESFSISWFEDESFPNAGLLPTTLTALEIWYASNLETLNGKALQQLTSLTKLSIYNCQSLRCLPEEGLPISLSHVKIWNCEQMVVLLPRTQQNATGLPSLVFLSIKECPVLESLLDWGSHPKLKRLALENCATLFENRKQWGLHRLSCLEMVRISRWEDDSFPDEGFFPTTLNTLQIFDSCNLETLNGNALQQLTSLAAMEIDKCGKLRCLPEQGLPTSLSSLHINGCPLLKQRCEKGGEDWPKIQHIDRVVVDYKRIS
ncbi:putative disease resistance protein At3g14460 isoform X2 [Humulus lupulus]|uniref:putative disease resistance protein At3g14460 isoform X2 n=1 Tax=Humulus lupulus TaxID=3486 RepID=UPI002B4072C7|nr:putative disease resistance protein At3g14460 isoform X2 [Humulus lupulus]